MTLFISILILLLLAAVYAGYQRIIRIEHLSSARIVNGLLIAFSLITLMSLAHWLNLISQALAAKVTTSAYTMAGGYFLGYGTKLISLRNEAGNIEYMYRSFWTDIAPNLIFIALFVFGIYRTGILDWQYFTGIGIASGLSLVGFGYMGWTLRIVPEFRFHGILILDQFIEWKKVVSYRWVDEETLQVDYLNASSKISDFKTFIPSEDQLIIERLLGRKLEEYEDERQKIMAENSDNSSKNVLNT